MPELPEVETIRRQLQPRLVGRRFVEAHAHPSAKFTPAHDVTGLTITDVGRRGKYLLVGLCSRGGEPEPETERELIVHLGMTGQLGLHEPPSTEADRPVPLEDPYLRAWWQLDDETFLLFRDVRRFGRLRVVAAGDYRTIPTLAKAGPEPFDPALTGEEFWRLLKASRRKIKTNLLSQRPIAGVGNIYADEALWLAGINPSSTRLGRERAALLLECLREVLEQGIDNGGTTLNDYRNAEGGVGANQHRLAAYGREGRPCRKCASPLSKAMLDGRSTTWCPSCQKR